MPTTLNFPTQLEFTIAADKMSHGAVCQPDHRVSEGSTTACAPNDTPLYIDDTNPHPTSQQFLFDQQQVALPASMADCRPVHWSYKHDGYGQAVEAPNIYSPETWPPLVNELSTTHTSCPCYASQRVPMAQPVVSSYGPIYPRGHQSSDSAIQGPISPLATSFTNTSADHKSTPHFDFAFRISSERTVTGEDEDLDDRKTIDSQESFTNERPSRTSYAHLIYQALMEAPSHSLLTRDIYKWIEVNTDKTSASASKGWRSSVRHNLSVNKAFIKSPHIGAQPNSKDEYIWVLDPSALHRGVKATAQHRSKAPRHAGHRSMVTTKSSQSAQTRDHAARIKFSRKRGYRSPRSPKHKRASDSHPWSSMISEPGDPRASCTSVGSDSSASSTPFPSSCNHQDAGNWSPAMSALLPTSALSKVNGLPHAAGAGYAMGDYYNHDGGTGYP